jgi:hypothetical protein
VARCATGSHHVRRLDNGAVIVFDARPFMWRFENVGCAPLGLAICRDDNPMSQPSSTRSQTDPRQFLRMNGHTAYPYSNWLARWRSVRSIFHLNCRRGHRGAHERLALWALPSVQLKMAHSMDAAIQRQLRDMAGNQNCVDCGAPQPSWASISYGTLFCLGTSSKRAPLFDVPVRGFHSATPLPPTFCRPPAYAPYTQSAPGATAGWACTSPSYGP